MTVFVPSIRFRPAKRETMQARLGSSGVVLAATLGLLTSTLSSAQVPDARSDAEIEAEVSRLQQLLAQRRQSGSSAPEETRRRNTSELAVLDTVNVISNAARTPPPLEQLKDIPKSVSVVAGEELEKTQTNDFRNILSRIGNVSQTYTNPQSSSLVIRGLGWTTGAGPLDPSVGVTVDGVSYGVTGMAAAPNYTDLETVDVTRGPQGTLGAKNTSVGQITVRTRAPSFSPEANAALTIGAQKTINTTAAVGGSIVDGLLAWRGTFLREQADGPWKNVNDNNVSYRPTDRTYGRAQFLLTPGKDFTARLSFDFMPVGKEASNEHVFFKRATPDYYDSRDANGNPVAVNQANEPTGKLSRRWFAQEPNYVASDFVGDYINRLNQFPSAYGTKGASAALTWNLGTHTLSSISAFRDFYFDSGGSAVITPFDIDRSPASGHVEYKQYTQELRFQSQSNGLFDYQAGLYYFHNLIPERWNTARYGSDGGAYYATTAQYNRLDADSNGRAIMQNSIDRLIVRSNDHIDNTSSAIYGNGNWHVNESLTINGGVRLTHENRKTDSQNGVLDQGFGPELNPASINNVQLGGFNSSSSGALTTNSAAQLTLANYVANKYFGVTNYSSLTAAQRQQVADAKAIRLARLGGQYAQTYAAPFKQDLPTFTLGPSYRINDGQTAYVSWQHGEKAGISQIVGATINGGKSAPAESEKTNTYELGLKSVLLDRSLVINADIYVQNVRNYIQPLYYYDEAQTLANNDGKLAYTSGLGNVPKVQSKGVELDLAYSGIRYTTIRFAGAYNDARYKDFRFLAKPAELAADATPYYDVTGRTLPGAPRFTFNIFAEYARPVLTGKNFHASINYHYTSSFNNDPSLSRYAVVDAYGLTDLAIGLGRTDNIFDANIVVKNLFDTRYGFNSNWNTFFPSVPRWYGLTLGFKL